MTISKNNYIIIKNAALLSENLEVIKAIEQTERAEKERSLKTSAYIMERRKQDKNYCR